MPNTPQTPQSRLGGQALQEQLRELEEEAEKKKVKLTPEVQQYIREHLDAVQEKLVKGEPVFEGDMEFMGEVRMWVGLPEDLREKCSSIDSMKKVNGYQEAKKRHVSIQQWLDLLHVAKAYRKEKEWIDETFEFPGGRKIKARRRLDLRGCTNLTKLPEGLLVKENLYLGGSTSLTSLPEGLLVEGSLNLRGCTSITSLPDGLSVEKDLHLNGCESLTSLPDGLSVVGVLDLRECTSLTSLPDGLSVGRYLDLMGCTSLTSLPERLSVGGDLYLKHCISLTSLPDGLSVSGNLHLDGCTSLTSLPERLSVEGDLDLSKNLNEQVIKDAEKLKKEGKIKGYIIYV